LVRCHICQLNARMVPLEEAKSSRRSRASLLRWMVRTGRALEEGERIGIVYI
jgi:hypothetical protein